MRPRKCREMILRKYSRHIWVGKLDGSLHIKNRNGKTIRAFQEHEFDPEAASSRTTMCAIQRQLTNLIENQPQAFAQSSG